MGFWDGLGKFLEDMDDLFSTLKYGDVDKKTKEVAWVIESNLGVSSQLAVEISKELRELYKPTNRAIREVIEDHIGHTALREDIITKIRQILIS